MVSTAAGSRNVIAVDRSYFTVLVDKPVTATSEQAKELGLISKAKGLVLYAFQNRRWDSDYLALKKLLAEPETSKQSLGAITDFESQ